jgi:hypothetical protein
MRRPKWDRTYLARRVSAFLVLLMAVGVRLAHAQPASPSRPNVLFIASDDLNDDISAKGQSSRRVIELVDIYPTLAALTRVLYLSASALRPVR